MHIDRRPRPVEDSVEQIEFNKTVDPFNGTVTDQVIFWGYYGDELHVVDVRVRSKVESLHQGRERRPYIEFLDLSELRHPLYRRVYAGSIIETRTNEDPELDDMQFVPIHERRRLIGDSRHKDYARFKKRAA
jgi:hypothetical protein